MILIKIIESERKEKKRKKRRKNTKHERLLNETTFAVACVWIQQIFLMAAFPIVSMLGTCPFQIRLTVSRKQVIQTWLFLISANRLKLTLNQTLRIIRIFVVFLWAFTNWFWIRHISPSHRFYFAFLRAHSNQTANGHRRKWHLFINTEFIHHTLFEQLFSLRANIVWRETFTRTNSKRNFFFLKNKNE